MRYELMRGIRTEIYVCFIFDDGGSDGSDGIEGRKISRGTMRR